MKTLKITTFFLSAIGILACNTPKEEEPVATEQTVIRDSVVIVQQVDSSFYLRLVENQKIEQLRESDAEYISTLYTYLKHFHNSGNSKKSKLKYSKFFEDNTIESFEQTFDDGIKFTFYQGEGGFSETLELPKTSTKLIRAFITHYHGNYFPEDYELKHLWKDSLSFGPEDEGAGCYYQIEQKKKTTKITGGCGC